MCFGRLFTKLYCLCQLCGRYEARGSKPALQECSSKMSDLSKQIDSKNGEKKSLEEEIDKLRKRLANAQVRITCYIHVHAYFFLGHHWDSLMCVFIVHVYKLRRGQLYYQLNCTVVSLYWYMVQHFGDIFKKLIQTSNIILYILRYLCSCTQFTICDLCILNIKYV